MEFQIKPIRWDNEGSEPSEELKTNGFRAGYKPPASLFNRLLNNNQKVQAEMQEIVSNLYEDTTTSIKAADAAAQNALTAAAEAEVAAESASHPPKIGEDGRWYVWDAEHAVYKPDVMADGNTMFATFAIDTETGILSVTTPDEYKGAQFALNNDYLEVKV